MEVPLYNAAIISQNEAIRNTRKDFQIGTKEQKGKNFQTETKEQKKVRLRREREMGADMAAELLSKKKECRGEKSKRAYCRGGNYLNGEIVEFQKRARKLNGMSTPYGKLKEAAVALLTRANKISKHCDPFNEKLDVEGLEFKVKERAARFLSGAMGKVRNDVIECDESKGRRHFYNDIGGFGGLGFFGGFGLLSGILNYYRRSYVQSVRCFVKHKDAPGGREFVGTFNCYGWGTESSKCVM